MEKTVDTKLKECKELHIQNMQRNSVQKNMVFMYLKQNKLDQEVRNFTMNSKQGYLKLQFENHESAKKFYDNYNFKAAILLRPFNIYFNLQLNENQMKKFYLEGITEENQRKIFDAARKISVCKLYSNYTHPSRGKIKPTGVLSFIKKDQLLDSQFNDLKAELQKLDVKIQKYVAEKDLKCSIRITNFYKGSLTQDDDSIVKKGQDLLRQLLTPIVKDSITGITVNVKRKEIQNKGEKAEKEQPKIQTVVSGLVEFSGTMQTMDNFELIRNYYQDKNDGKATLFFHNDQNNSYLSLFTSNLKKPQGISDNQFQTRLLNVLKKVNPNVIQVNVYPVVRNQTYVGRVYLKSQMDGKNFIVDYTSKRQILNTYFKDNNSISFNINVDSKTLNKIKSAEKKATQIMKGVKNIDQTIKRRNNNQNKPINNVPLFGMNNINSMGPIMHPNINMMQGGPGIMGQFAMIPQQGLMGSNIPPPNIMKMENLQQNKMKLIRDKQQILKQTPQNAKKLLSNVLKPLIQDNGVPFAESGVILDHIMKNNDAVVIYQLLESSQELKKKINQYRNN